jgi:hypothetical protein
MWRLALAERTAELADNLQKREAELRANYAMRLPTVADRLAERFVRPLVIDRVRALVKPAIDEVRGGALAGASSSAEPVAGASAEARLCPTGARDRRDHAGADRRGF